jgi:putative endonuclease
MKYYVYILKSLKNSRYYIGSTKNLDRRIAEHNSGLTKGNRYMIPFELVYKEEYSDQSTARKRESHIKKQKSRKFIDSLIVR